MLSLACPVQARLYAKLQLTDTAGFHKLISSLSTPDAQHDIKLVIPNADLMPDYIKHFGIDTSQAVQFFADKTFYNYLNNKLPGNAVFLLNNKGRVLYQTQLAAYQPHITQYYTQYQQQKIDRITQLQDGLHWLNGSDNLTYNSKVDNIRRIQAIDVLLGKEYDLSFQKETVEQIYRIYFGKKFATRWPIIKDYLYTRPGLQPDINDLCYAKDRQHILAYVAVYDTILTCKHDHTIFNYSILGSYDISS